MNAIVEASNALAKNLLDHSNYVLFEEFDLNKFESKKLTIPLKKNLTKNVADTIFEPFLSYYHELLNANNFKSNEKNQRAKEYLDYILNEHNGTNRLFTRYPLLKSKVYNSINQYTAFIKKIISYLRKDQLDLQTTFGVSISNVSDITLGLGDMHAGKSVSEISFGDKTIIFKPQNNKTDTVIENCMHVLENYDLAHFYYPKRVEKDSHVWIENIIPYSPKKIKEIKDYYFSSGTLLALFWVLGSTDMHYENVIPLGAKPVIIDTETISKGSHHPNQEIEKYELQSSVIRTAFIPMSRLAKKDIDVDINALFPIKERSKSMKVYTIADDEKLDWIFQTEYYTLNSEATEILYNGTKIMPDIVSKSLVSGFSKALTLIKNHKKEFLNRITCVPFRSRQLLRDTRVYAEFIDALSMPESLESIHNVDNILGILLDTFKPGKLGYFRVQDEIYQLKKGNIPAYTTDANSCSLKNFSGQTIIAKYWRRTPIDAIIFRINNLTARDIEYQKRVLNMSLAMVYTSDDLFTLTNCEWNTDKALNRSEAVQNATSFLEYNMHNFIFKSMHSDHSIYEINFQKQTMDIVPSLPGIYHIGALVLILDRFSKIDKSLKKFYESLYTTEIKTLLSAEIKKRVSIDMFNVFSGWGGLIYTTAYLYADTHGKNYLDDLNKELSILNNSVLNWDKNTKEDASWEYMNGMTGLLLILTRVHSSIKVKHLSSVISNILSHINPNNVQKLLSSTQDNGIAHGKSGYLILCAIKYLNTSGEEKVIWLNIIKKLIMSINESHTFNDSRWCRGSAGIIDAYLIIRSTINDPDIIELINPQITKFIHQSNFLVSNTDNLNLCHGTYGVLNTLFSILNTSYKNFCTPEEYQLINKTFFAGVDQTRWIKSSNYSPLLYMLGPLGVLDTNLRISKDLPNLVTLELPHQKIGGAV
mgnify:CR=1 FL=1